MDQLISIIIFSHGIVFLWMAIFVASIRRKKPVHRKGMALLALTSCMCMGGGFYISVLPERELWRDLFVLLPMAALVPVGGNFVLGCFQARQGTRRLFGFHVFLAVALVGFGLWHILAERPAVLVFTPVYASLCVMLASVLVVAIIDLGSPANYQPGLLFFFILIVADCILTGLMALAQICAWDLLLYSAYTFFIATILGIVLIAFRSPSTYRLLEGDIDTARYRHRRISPERVPVLLDRFERAMREEECFLDPDLTLASLAEMLQIPPHELSELVNHYRGEGFNACINRYRVTWACERMKHKGEETLLEIAFESGFNSKTTFNTVFKAITGMPPGVWRGEHGLKG